ncbi:MAG: hypothetical protein SGPRY_007847, partial [Prymnesium sp.]
MAIGVIVPVLPQYATSVGLSPADVGLMIALPSLAKLCLNLPVGYAIDSIGRKPALVLGSLLDGVGSIATARSRQLRSVAPARLLVGAGSAGATIAEQAYLMDVVSKYPEHKGLLLGTAQELATHASRLSSVTFSTPTLAYLLPQALGMLAFAAGPALGGLMAERGSIRLPFLVIGLLLICTSPLYSLLPETLPTRTTRSPRPSFSAIASAIAAATASYRKLLSQRSQRALIAIRAGLTAGWSVWLTVIPLAAIETWGASAGELGQMFSLMTVLGLLAAPVGGRLSDRIGAVKVTSGGAIMSCLAVGLLSRARGKRSFYACMALWDLGESTMTAALNAYAAEVTSEEQRGAMNSLANQVESARGCLRTREIMSSRCMCQVQDAVFVVLPLVLGYVAAKTSNA